MSDKKKALTVYDATYNLLRKLGLTTIFGNPGSTEQPFLKNLRKAVCHSHGGRLLQTQYIFEVRREVLEKRLLSRTGIPENGGQSQLPQ